MRGGGVGEFLFGFLGGEEYSRGGEDSSQREGVRHRGVSSGGGRVAVKSKRKVVVRGRVSKEPQICRTSFTWRTWTLGEKVEHKEGRKRGSLWKRKGVTL